MLPVQIRGWYYRIGLNNVVGPFHTYMQASAYRAGVVLELKLREQRVKQLAAYLPRTVRKLALGDRTGLVSLPRFMTVGETWPADIAIVAPQFAGTAAE